jgi:superfamily II DNA or RNA helicase
MEIIISNIIKVHEPTKEILDYCKKELIIKNPDFNKKVQMGFFVGGTPRYIHLFDKINDDVYLPIGCFKDLWNMYPDKSLYHDYSSVVKRNIKSSIKLRDYQEPCLNALKKYVNGLFILPCGLGKTECALQTAYYLQQHTLFITHTKDLMNQAKDRCEEKMECTTSVISDGEVDTHGDVVFATVQTLFKHLEDIEQDEFGLVVIDECHHLAANADTVAMFRTSLDYFAARYKLGLTATLHRADGLEQCIPKLLGEIIYEIKEDGDDYVGIYEGKEVIRFPKTQFQVPAKVNIINTNYQLYDATTGYYRDVFDRNGMTLSFTKLISDIANDKKRNQIIVDLCNSLKGSTIVLSDRVDQLKYLNELIDNSIEIDGSTKKATREQALEDVKNGKYKVLLASYKLAKEGLDCKILENVVFATPVKDEAIVIQCIGRAQRTYEGKTIANIYDLVDDVSMLDRFFVKRRSVYKRKGWF